MLISKELEKAFNQQIGNEFGASLEYVNIAAYFKAEDMLQFAKIFFAQSEEERQHALRFVGYVLDAGGRVAVPAIPQPRAEFKSAEEAVSAALEWEETVTKQINGLVELAAKEKDHIAQEFLSWFVSEQLEEVSKMSTILNVIRRAGGNLLLAETYVMSALAGSESGAE